MRGQHKPSPRGFSKGHPLYFIWKTMRLRCNTPTCKKYPRYGGRGISICERWDDFWNFVDDMGPRPEGTSIDRIDNDGNYEPGNCRWATPKVQGRNTSTNRFVEIGGEVIALTELAEREGIKAGTLRKRIAELGWTIEDAVSIHPRSPAAYAHQRRHLKSICNRGHAFSEGSYRIDHNGARVCRACESIRNRIAREKRNAR